MGDRLHQAPRGARRQLRVGIEGDHGAHRQRQRTLMQDLGRTRAGQKGIELVDLAALAVAPDPLLLAFRPLPAAMEQQEMAFRIARIQCGDSFAHNLHQFGVAGDVALRGVGEVREQAEKKVLLLVRQETNFQLFHFAASDGQYSRPGRRLPGCPWNSRRN